MAFGIQLLMKIPFQNFWGNHKIGKETKIGAFVEIGNGVKIGSNCKIQAFAYIPPGVAIEDWVFIGPHVCFTNDKRPTIGAEWKIQPTLVKEGAVIGANATILPGITIGRNAVVGAGAVVVKSIPNNETWVGNPAHKI